MFLSLLFSAHSALASPSLGSISSSGNEEVVPVVSSGLCSSGLRSSMVLSTLSGWQASVWLHPSILLLPFPHTTTSGSLWKSLSVCGIQFTLNHAKMQILGLHVYRNRISGGDAWGSCFYIVKKYVFKTHGCRVRSTTLTPLPPQILHSSLCQSLLLTLQGSAFSNRSKQSHLIINSNDRFGRH